MPFPFLSIIPVIGDIIDRVIPDKNAAAQAKLELEKQAMAGDLQVQLAQLDINKTEAASQDWFERDWRPFIGWICGSALAYTYIVQPFLTFALVAFGKQVALPALSLADLLPVLFALLGLGGMRSYEVVKGAKPPDTP